MGKSFGLGERRRCAGRLLFQVVPDSDVGHPLGVILREEYYCWRCDWWWWSGVAGVVWWVVGRDCSMAHAIVGVGRARRDKTG